MKHILVYQGESGSWVAEVPSLPGCVGQGSSREEAVQNIKLAIELHVEVLRDHGQQVPEDNLNATLVAV